MPVLEWAGSGWYKVGRWEGVLQVQRQEQEGGIHFRCIECKRGCAPTHSGVDNNSAGMERPPCLEVISMRVVYGDRLVGG